MRIFDTEAIGEVGNELQPVFLHLVEKMTRLPFHVHVGIQILPHAALQQRLRIRLHFRFAQPANVDLLEQAEQL